MGAPGAASTRASPGATCGCARCTTLRSNCAPAAPKPKGPPQVRPVGSPPRAAPGRLLDPRRRARRGRRREARGAGAEPPGAGHLRRAPAARRSGRCGAPSSRSSWRSPPGVARRARRGRVGRRRADARVFAAALGDRAGARPGGRAVRVLRRALARRRRARGRATSCSPPPSPRCRSLPEGDVSTDAWLAVGLGARAARRRRARASPCSRWRARSAMLRLRRRPAGRAGDPRGGAAARRAHRRWSSASRSRRRRASALAVFASEGCALCQARRAGGRAARARAAGSRSRSSTSARRRRLARARGARQPVRRRARPADGTVLAKGTFNGLAQLESVLVGRRAAGAEAGACLTSARSRTGSPRGTSRRGLLARVGRRARRRHGGRRWWPSADQARRGRGLPLLRPHLHDRLLPAPDRAPAHRRPRLPAARAGRQAGRRPRPPHRRARAARSTSTARLLHRPRRPAAAASPPRTQGLHDAPPRCYGFHAADRRLLVPLLRRPRAQAHRLLRATRDGASTATPR